MAIKSMTGYGRGRASLSGAMAEVEISSVNRKQIDVRLVLPRGLTVLESRITEMVQSVMSRGHITVSLQIRWSESLLRHEVGVNHHMAAAYVAALRKTASALKLKDDLNASILVKLPDVLHHHDPAGCAEQAWPAIAAAVKKAVGAHGLMREAEGRRLSRDLMKRQTLLRRAVERLRRLAPLVTRHYRQSLIERLKSAGVEMPANDATLLRELAVFAERSDITEELTRLASHLDQVGKALKSSEPVGRSLDFLAQELFREINTIGSKSNDLAISREVIAFKAELERMREQFQNIE